MCQIMFLVAPNYQCPLICIISSNFWQIVKQVIGYVFFLKSCFLISHFLFFYKCRMGFEKQRERRLVLGVHHTAHVCMFICLLWDVVCLCRPHWPGTLCSPRWPQTHVPALLLSLPRAGIAGMQCCASLFCSFKTRLFLHQLVIS